MLTCCLGVVIVDDEFTWGHVRQTVLLQGKVTAITRSDEATESVMYSQYFTIKGAAWEDRYQDCLKLLHKEKVKVRAKPEPGNIQDKNAIKFEAFLNCDWHILGYCVLAKIPKLKKALQNEEITNITIANLRRTWVHPSERLPILRCEHCEERDLGKR